MFSIRARRGKRALAESRDFELVELIELETWPRYGLHSANAVNGEDALVLRVPG